MADRADVYVKNTLTDSINVIRKLPDGSSKPPVTIATGIEEKIYLPSPEVSLVIYAPTGVDTKDCLLKVQSDIDLASAYSRTDSTWTFRIEPNDLPPDAPITVNVTLGTDEPD
jgi:hypothetical protein